MLLGVQMTVTQVRQDMSTFADQVIHQAPSVLVTRGRREAFVAIEHSRFRRVLSTYRFTLEYEKGEDGRYYGSVNEIPDIIGDGDSLEELKKDLAGYLVEYARNYEKDLQLYYNAPNRQRHFGHVLHILAQESVEDVCGLID